MLIKGSELTEAQRVQVLARFVYRHTVENAKARGVPCVLCATGGPADRIVVIPAGQQAAGEVRKTWHEHHVTAQSDSEWLADHAFHFRKADGQLMPGRYAEPSWRGITGTR